MPLARWQATIQDEAGNVVPQASVEVRREVPGAPLVQLYSDRDGAEPLGNPFQAGADGFAAFHVHGGAYRITAKKAGLEPKIWRYVGIGLGGETDLLSALNPRGAWDNSETYGIGDLVSHIDGGNPYLFASITDSNSGNEPDAGTPDDTADWMFLGDAVAGPPGPPGAIVPTGPWISNVAYAAGEAVHHDGVAYICVAPHTGVEPGLNFRPESEAIFAAMTGLTDGRKLLTDHLVQRQIGHDTWSKKGLLYVMAAHSDAAARVDWKGFAPAPLTNTNGAVPFTADVAFIGDGTNALSTTVQEASIPGFAQNDAHIGVWVLTEVSADNHYAVGSSTTGGSRINPRTVGGNMASRINGTNNASSTVASSVGHSVASRDNSASFVTHRNGAALETETETSVAPTTNIARIFADSGFRFTGGVAFAHWGAGLTAQNVADDYDDFSFWLAGLSDPPDYYYWESFWMPLISPEVPAEFFEFIETTAPATPQFGHARLYVEDGLVKLRRDDGSTHVITMTPE